MEVAILGCGPAGLIAAHAVEKFGGEPTIISSKVKSVIPGSQYLHEPIPGLTSVYPENTVQYVRMGTAQGYAKKVYGDADRYTGWDNYRALYPSWNVVKAYDTLWERYEDCIINFSLHNTEDIKGIIDTYELIISTIPQQYLCVAEHEFVGVPYLIKPLPLPEVDRGHDLVIYNGMFHDHWYRYSILGDRCSIETTWGQAAEQDDDWLSGTKAVSNNCDCWGESGRLVRAGRWAEWKHGVLLHDVYHRVKEVMNGR